ncbi:hypothetical protein [Algoriphagus sp.]|uniref:hypothetical protein n=1 Tax=Algoriphagus sp. TaxID=1872435 RepID=UPI003919A758
MNKFQELKEKELIDVHGGGLSEIGEALWGAVGYVARVWDISCRLAANNGTLTDPQFHSK